MNHKVGRASRLAAGWGLLILEPKSAGKPDALQALRDLLRGVWLGAPAFGVRALERRFACQWEVARSTKGSWSQGVTNRPWGLIHESANWVAKIKKSLKIPANRLLKTYVRSNVRISGRISSG